MFIGILDNFVYISITIYFKCHFPSFRTERDVNTHFTNTEVYHMFFFLLYPKLLGFNREDS